jgi:hypothetical protein
MITLVLGIALLGFLVYLIITYIPMPDIFQKAIVVIAIVFVVLYLVNLFGFDIPLPNRK